MIYLQYINKKVLVFSLLLSFTFFRAIAQNMIPVDLHTGTANITIPLYSIQENDLSLPIGIYYNTTGIKVNHSVGWLTYGEYGWNLQAAGQVSRIVRDLPDDCNSGGLLGWLNYSGNFFSVNNPPSCTDEAGYYNNLNGTGSFNYMHDTEPDLFSFNCGDIAGQFIIDRNGQVRMMPYQDVKITYTKNAQSQITGFVICNNRGYSFQFKAVTSATKVASASVYSQPWVGYCNSRPYNQAMIGYSYTTSWGLTEMDSPAGSKITFSYGNVSNTSGGSDHSIIYQESAPSDTSVTANYKKQTLYSIYTNDTTRALTSIVSSTKEVDFSLGSIMVYNKTTSGALELMKKILFYGTGLTISGDISCSGNPTGSYKFDYYGGSTYFPPQTNSIDFWGFFNNRKNTSLIPKIYVYYNLTGSDRYRLNPIPGNSQYYTLNGSNRTANPDVVMNGSLKQITYPAGSITRFEYESNQYYDQTAQTNFYGGGIRVKKITYSEGSGNSPDIVKTYTYAPNSGRLIYQPTFAYPTPFYRDFYNGGTPTYVPSNLTGFGRWNFFTLRSEEDLSPPEEANGNYVFYLSATEIQVGKGSTQKDYLFPAAYGQTTYSTDWAASYTNIARAASTPACFDVGIVTPDYYTYPYPPNTNYSFERGLLNKETIYNDAGQVLKEHYYTYQRVTPAPTPVSITGIRTVSLSNGTNSYSAFSLYNMLTDVTKLSSTVREVTYDPTNLSQSTETTTSSFYDSPYHKLLSRTTTLTKDGSIYTTKYKYPLDYSIYGTITDDNTAIIYKFQTPFVNSYSINNYLTGVVVEKTSSLQKPGQSDMVIGSSLTKFKTFTTYSPGQTTPVMLPLPYQHLSLAINAPINDFASASVPAGTTLTSDSRYRLMQTIEAYDSKGNVTSSVNNQRARNGAHYDATQTMPVLQVTNASATQVAYSGFETISTNSFVYSDLSNPVPVSPGRTGNNSLNLAANTILKQSVGKGPGQNYIFSCWIQTTNATGTLTLTLTDGTNTATYPINYTTNNNAWTYYQKIVPITQFGATFTVSFLASNAVSIDDIVFFPANSNITYFTYNKFGKTSETNANGISKFYQYDDNGAVHYVLDADQNIVQRNIYNYKASVSLAVQPVVNDNVFPSGNKVGDNLTFNIADLSAFSCLSGTFMYSWDFGDGTTTTPSATVAQNHIYTHYGNYKYSVTVTSSVYGSQKTYGNIMVFQKDISAYVCNSSGPIVTFLCPAVTAYQWDNCNGAHTGTIGHNTFTATVINPYDATACPIQYHYIWYTAPLGSTNWVYQPQFNDMASITINIANPYAPQISDSYSVRCDISTLFPCPAAQIGSLYQPATATSSTVFIQRSPNNTPPCN